MKPNTLLPILQILFTFTAWVSTTHANPVPQKTWRVAITKEMQKEFCNAKTYFRQCFDTDDKTCQAEVDRTSYLCFAKHSLPKKLADDTEGLKTAYRHGACVGETLEKGLKSKKTSGAACSKVDPWVL